MCGRFNLTSEIEDLAEAFSVKARAPIMARYNIAPRQPVLIVRLDDRGRRTLAAVEWGFVPEWSKEISSKPLINARIETIEAKPSFRSSIVRRRCLVPFDGWYEWKREGGENRPYLVEPVDSRVQAFAGIWETWHGPGGENWLETMAIITGEATGGLRPLHRRRPLVVNAEDYESWLRPHDPLPRNFLKDFDWMTERHFHFRRVSTRINSPRHDDPSCISPAEDVSQGSLF